MATERSAETIFNKAVEITDPTEQAAFLDQACAGDEKLRAQVDALLKWNQEAGSFLEAPDDDPNVTLDGPAIPEASGTVIGRYKLLEKIGEGGMATVYMAEQKHPIRRRVALKIIKLGMDTKQVIGRFEAERQALAMMDHPNIAKVLDAGTTDAGRPYFVMELVRGQSITKFCDSNHLNTQERLDLFISVCNAVQHAHQRGIIHRDLKPSNIIVTLQDGEPVAKVIDFGIAKAVNQQLTEKTVFTRYSQMIGTPEYMSPEQAEMSGLDIDTRTDVFSLGVILYELLTGSTPFDSEYLLSKGYAEMQRIIREEEPARPSTKISTMGKALTQIAKSRRTKPELLCKLIRTDLDWIVMKTLEKDRSRRYGTVSELAADVKRHQDHEPVLAGRPSAMYRMQKFVRRRRALVGAGTAIAATIIIALAVFAALYVRTARALRNEEAALEQEADAREDLQQLTDFFTDDFMASVYPERVQGQQVTVRYLLQAASENLNGKFETNPLVEAKIRDTLGLTYSKLADFVAAEPHLTQAWEIRRKKLGEDHAETAAAQAALGRMYMRSARVKDAERHLRKALEAQTRLLGREHEDTLGTMADLAQLCLFFGLPGGIEWGSEAFTTADRVLGRNHPVFLRAALPAVYRLVGVGAHELGEKRAKLGYTLSREVNGERHEVTLTFLCLQAWATEGQGRLDEAYALTVDTLDACKTVLGEKHFVTSMLISELGWIYFKQGNYEEAEPRLKRAIKINRQVYQGEHLVTHVFMLRLAQFYQKQERYEEMDAILTEAIALRRQAAPTERYATSFFEVLLHERISQLLATARQQYQAAQYGEALASLTRIERFRPSLAPEHADSPPAQVVLAMKCQLQLGNRTGAKSGLLKLRGLYAKDGHGEDDLYLYQAEKCLLDRGSRFYRIWDLIEKGLFDEAGKLLETGQSSSSGDGDAEGAAVANLRQALSRAYCARGSRSAVGAQEYTEAIGDFETAIRVDPNSIRAHNLLASLLASCPDAAARDGARAIAHAKKACALSDQQNGHYLSTLAAAHAEVGGYTIACARQREAIEWHRRKGESESVKDCEVRLSLYESQKPLRRSSAVRWDFEEHATRRVEDTSGNGLHGRLIGDAAIVYDPKRGGKALRLTGIGDRLECGDDPRLRPTIAITVACWLKVNTFSRIWQPFVSKGVKNLDQQGSWMLCRKAGSSQLYFRCKGVRGEPANGITDVNDGKWHHVVAIFDGACYRMYVDGGLERSYKASGEIKNDDSSVFVGEKVTDGEGGSAKPCDVLLDDVRIYDYALTESGIQALYLGTKKSSGDKQD